MAPTSTATRGAHPPPASKRLGVMATAAGDAMPQTTSKCTTAPTSDLAMSTPMI
jgi:hypothetical protein